MTELNTNSQQASWVDARTACELLNISYKTLKNKCYLNQLNYKIIKNGNKSNYFINKDSLPELFIKGFTSKFSDKKYSEVPNWARGTLARTD